MDLPPFALDPTSLLPPYEQIRVQLLTLIACGRLTPGAQLPSVRQLARDLGVAPNTVVRAYAELKADGWVTMSLRRGVSVAERPLTLSESERLAEVDAAVAQMLTRIRPLGVDAAAIHAAVDRQLRPPRIEGRPA
jgi:DNA-binding transcriptional regulator YhcF (GntR family)